jgi:NSS family neurotransmitter:Na+ symporter
MQNRETWSSRAGFIMAAVGSAIGLGNIWRFPYMAYENGGGAFLIPYLIAMVTAGIPFMIMEFGLGHKFRGSAPRIFSSISRRWEWLGWLQVLVAFAIATYYVVVIAWAMCYFVFSFSQAWGASPADFFFKDYLHLTGSPLELGSINMPVLGASVLAWGVTFMAVFSGVRGGIERLNKVFMPLLFVMVLVFIGRGVMLPGAAEGLQWLFRPDFSAILDHQVWADAYGQIFYSLSVGFAIMLAYSSYLPKKSDVNNNATMTVFINCGFSMLGGLMVFSVLGYMAAQKGVAVSEVVSSGVGLAFITLPTAINLMPMPVFFGALFFLALTVAGLSSQVSITEAVVSTIVDKLDMTRKGASVVVCVLGFLISAVFTTGGGLLLLDIVDHFINNFGVLCCGLLEIVMISWFCKLGDLQEHVNSVSEFRVGTLWQVCLRFIAPIMMTYMVIMNFYTDLTKNYGDYSDTAIMAFGWAVLGVSLVLAFVLPSKEMAFAGYSGSNRNFLRRG